MECPEGGVHASTLVAEFQDELVHGSWIRSDSVCPIPLNYMRGDPFQLELFDDMGATSDVKKIDLVERWDSFMTKTVHCIEIGPHKRRYTL